MPCTVLGVKDPKVMGGGGVSCPHGTDVLGEENRTDQSHVDLSLLNNRKIRYGLLQEGLSED